MVLEEIEAKRRKAEIRTEGRTQITNSTDTP